MIKRSFTRSSSSRFSSTQLTQGSRVYRPRIMIFLASQSHPRPQNFDRDSKYCTQPNVEASNRRSKSLHPDKSTTANGAFLAVRHAYQTLLNPHKRRAYDLFGPIISQWDLHSERGFLLRGVCWGVLPGYVISFIALQVWGLFGRGGQVKYVTQSLAQS